MVIEIINNYWMMLIKMMRFVIVEGLFIDYECWSELIDFWDRVEEEWKIVIF